MKISDKQWLEKFKDGNENAFELVFKTYHARLFLMAKKYIFEPDAAKDLVQDSFIGLFEKREIIDSLTSAKSYLFQTLHNKCLNYIKHQRIKEKHKEYAINQLKLLEIYYFDSLENGSKSLLEQEVEDKIKEAIASLPPQCQSIFKLSRFEGLKNKEIAEKLNISVKTVENQMTIALKKLTEFLKDYLLLILIINKDFLKL